MTVLPVELRAALAGPMVPKFLATVGPAGEPNIVPVISLQPWDDATLVFGEYLMVKSRRNLAGNPKVGVLVVTEALRAWALRGTFLGFEETGAWFERVSQSELLRYNAYTGIRAAGGIRIEGVSPAVDFGKAEVLAGFLRARALRPLLTPARGTPPRMPSRVQEKLARLQALRAAAYVDDEGFPRAFPLLSCFPAGPSRLVIADCSFDAIARDLAPGARLAVCVLTFDPVAYQVKGRYAGRRAGVGIVDLTECYSACPPRVGARLDHGRRGSPHLLDFVTLSF